MAEQALDRMQVHASFQQVGRKRVPQRMNATGLRDAGATLRRLIRPLQAGRIQRLRPPWGGNNQVVGCATLQYERSSSSKWADRMV